MAKIKYLVMGIENQNLSGLVGALTQGEVGGDVELLCCVGFPQAYKVSGNGQVQAIPFETLLTDLVRQEKAARARGGTELKLVPKEG